MMINMNVHDVSDLRVTPRKTCKEGTIKWRDIVITTDKGKMIITVFPKGKYDLTVTSEE